MIKFLWQTLQTLATIEYAIDKARKIEPHVKPYLDRLNNSLDAIKKQRVDDAIEEKVKQGWERKAAEIAVLWENNIIDDIEFENLIRYYKLIKKEE